MQILAPESNVFGGKGNNLSTSFDNYGGCVASLRAIAQGVEGLLQHCEVLSSGIKWLLHWVTHS